MKKKRHHIPIKIFSFIVIASGKLPCGIMTYFRNKYPRVVTGSQRMCILPSQMLDGMYSNYMSATGSEK